MAAGKDYYAILGVLPSIDQAALAAVYRALLKKYHPDVYAGPKLDGERITKELNEAFSIVGDSAKRAAYDKARASERPKSDDYERQQDWERSGSGDPEPQTLGEWQYVVRYHPNIERYRNELRELSPALAFSFQVTIIESKSPSQAEAIAAALKRQFLERYFGTNPTIHAFVLQALKAKRRDVALEVNRAIKVLGSPDSRSEHSFLKTVRNTTHWYGATWYEQATPSPAGFKDSSKRLGIVLIVATIVLLLAVMSTHH